MNVMNTMFENNALDMIALESAMTLFEVENDITPEYLASDYSRDEAAGFVAGATEGAADADDFLATLFTDTQPRLSAATEASGESLGARIGGTIKKIVGAIKNFFANLASKFKTKQDKVETILDKAEQANLSPVEQKVLDEARDVRAAANKLVGILNTSFRTESAQIEKVCKAVEDSIKSMHKGGHTLMETGEGASKKEQYDANQNNVKASIDYAKSLSGRLGKDSDETTRQANTRAELNMANTALTHMKKIYEDVKAAYAIVQEKAEALFKRLAKEAFTKEIDEHFEEGISGMAKPNADKDDAIAKGIADKQKKFEENRKKEFEGGKDNSFGKTDIEKVQNILTKSFYAKEGNLIRSMLGVVDNVVKVCTDQVKNCDLIMKATDAIQNDGPYAKIAYESCKIYKEASVVYNGLSSYLNYCLDCGFFRTTGSKKKADKNEEKIANVN